MSYDSISSGLHVGDDVLVYFRYPKNGQQHSAYLSGPVTDFNSAYVGVQTSGGYRRVNTDDVYRIDVIHDDMDDAAETEGSN